MFFSMLHAGDWARMKFSLPVKSRTSLQTQFLRRCEHRNGRGADNIVSRTEVHLNFQRMLRGRKIGTNALSSSFVGRDSRSDKAPGVFESEQA